jgi:6-pyruvoyltetrahydropterin/6-carboxytetrahydropterin synthase
MGFFRIAKTFEVEYAHRLSKHPEKCRFPHGHRLRIEVVVRGHELDDNDMVCDYKALKTLVLDLVEELDHGLGVSSIDPQRSVLEEMSARILVFEGVDPTTEVLVKQLFDEISDRLTPGREVVTSSGVVYTIPRGLRLERVRVWETSTSWAEYAADAG